MDVFNIFNSDFRRSTSHKYIFAYGTLVLQDENVEDSGLGAFIPLYQNYR